MRGAPTEFEIWQKSKSEGVCRGCGARITWAQTVKNGKRIPLTGRPAILRTHQHASGQMIEVVESGQSHFATCPDAERFRKKKG